MRPISYLSQQRRIIFGDCDLLKQFEAITNFISQKVFNLLYLMIQFVYWDSYLKISLINPFFLMGLVLIIRIANGLMLTERSLMTTSAHNLMVSVDTTILNLRF